MWILIVVAIYLKGDRSISGLYPLGFLVAFFFKPFKITQMFKQIFVGDKSIKMKDCFWNVVEIDIRRAKSVEFLPLANRTIGRFEYFGDSGQIQEAYFIPAYSELKAQIGALETAFITASNKALNSHMLKRGG